MNKHYKALELDKILERLSAETACEDAKEAALSCEPAQSLAEAERLLEQTCDAHALLARYGGPSFGGLKNVNNLLHTASSGGVLSMHSLLRVAFSLRALRSIKEWHSQCSEASGSLQKYFAAISSNRKIEDRIFSCIISDDEMADTASKELLSIRRSLRRKEEKIREQLDHIVRSEHYRTALQDAVITMRNGRYVVPVKREHKSEVAGLVQDTSDSGATVFIEPLSVVEANNDIKELLGREHEEIERILAELSAEVGELREETARGFAAAVILNLIFAKANLAYSMKATAPLLNDEGVIELKAARHPLLDPKKAVSVDISLGESFDTLVITGPNTGGKTVSLKTVGLLTLMAACGLMIPASEGSRLAVFKKVFADIGDEQSIEQSLSTFSAHMTNIAEILKQAGPSTLLLVDEIGAGTDPVEGAALATALLESFRDSGAVTAATTHYAELKEYALRTPRVENASCEFDIDTLSPTYRLIIGAPGRSNAFAISKRLGIPESVVSRARSLISEEGSRFEEAVEKLEESRSGLEAERRKAAELLRLAEESKRLAEESAEETKKLRDEELEKARREAARTVERARRGAFELLDELERLKKESRDPGKSAAAARAEFKKRDREFAELTDPVVKPYDGDYVLPRELVPGDTVLIADIGTEAVVLSPPDRSGLVELSSGALKSRVDIKRLRLLQKKRKRGTERSRNTLPSKSELKLQSSLDLRGLAADEAITELDRFLDLQLRLSTGEFTVIHGKGTGVLRKAVASYLSGNRQVKEFRLGGFGEGEDGVTVVTLK